MFTFPTENIVYTLCIVSFVLKLLFILELDVQSFIFHVSCLMILLSHCTSELSIGISQFTNTFDH